MDGQQKDIVTFLILHPDFFRELVSQFYPLTPSQLIKYKEILNWQKISSNNNIYWTVETIKSVAAQLDWKIFTTNSAAFRDLSALYKFDHLIDWQGYKNSDLDSIANNLGLPWSKEFIARYKNKINFKKLSSNTAVDWSEELIDLYSERWDYEKLAMNNSFPWSIHLFEKYLDTSVFFYFDVKSNKQFISDVQFIEKYSNYLDWHSIFSNPELPWFYFNLLRRWEEHINWFGIARNSGFFQNDPKFFNNNLCHWLELALCKKGKAISQNIALPWSVDFIAEYEELWDWEILSTNTGIPWSKELIERFKSQLVWGGESPCAQYDEKGNFVSEYGGSSFQCGLVTNESLPWSIDFITYFNESIDLETLAENKSVWGKAFKLHLTDEMIELIYSIL